MKRKKQPQAEEAPPPAAVWRWARTDEREKVSDAQTLPIWPPGSSRRPSAIELEHRSPPSAFGLGRSSRGRRRGCEVHTYAMRANPDGCSVRSGARCSKPSACRVASSATICHLRSPHISASLSSPAIALSTQMPMRARHDVTAATQHGIEHPLEAPGLEGSYETPGNPTTRLNSASGFGIKHAYRRSLPRPCRVRAVVGPKERGAASARDPSSQSSSLRCPLVYRVHIASPKLEHRNPMPGIGNAF